MVSPANAEETCTIQVRPWIPADQPPFESSVNHVNSEENDLSNFQVRLQQARLYAQQVRVRKEMGSKYAHAKP